MLGKWIDPDIMQLCWRTARTGLTTAEREYREQWEIGKGRFVQVQQRGAWLGSGLLRRAALLNTVANTFFADGYRGAAFNLARLVVRSSHVRGQGPGPHHVVAALLDPTFSLPLRLTGFRGDTDQRHAGDRRFVLTDPAKTARLELRASIERHPRHLAPDLWHSILRRLPNNGFSNDHPHGFFAEQRGSDGPSRGVSVEAREGSTESRKSALRATGNRGSLETAGVGWVCLR